MGTFWYGLKWKFHSHCFSRFVPKLRLIFSLSDLAYFTLFRFAEKVNDADKKQLHRTKLTGFKVNLQKN